MITNGNCLNLHIYFFQWNKASKFLFLLTALIFLCFTTPKNMLNPPVFFSLFFHFQSLTLYWFNIYNLAIQSVFVHMINHIFFLSSISVLGGSLWGYFRFCRRIFQRSLGAKRALSWSSLEMEVSGVKCSWCNASSLLSFVMMLNRASNMY